MKFFRSIYLPRCKLKLNTKILQQCTDLEENVEEEEIRVGDGEEKGMRLAYCFDVRELVGKLGDDGDVVLEAMEDALSVGLKQVSTFASKMS